MLNLGLRLRQGKHAYFPLDTIQDAQFATSLDKLYSGVDKTIRVTRELDLAEKDIGFVGSGIDEQDLLNFAGDSSLYVNTWYDQAGLKKWSNYAVEYNNLVSNGNMVDTSGWGASLNSATFSANNNILTMSATGNQSFAVATTTTSYEFVDSGKVFVRVIFENISENTNQIRLRKRGLTTSGIENLVSVVNPSQDETYVLYAITSKGSSEGLMRIFLQTYYDDALSATGQSVDIRECIAIDMGVDTTNPLYNLTADEMNEQFPFVADTGTTIADLTVNANNATQATLENMPRIVNEGVIEREPLTGKIMPYFDGSNDFIRNTSIGILPQPTSVIVKSIRITGSGSAYILDGTTLAGRQALVAAADNTMRMNAGGDTINIHSNNTSLTVTTAIFNGEESKGYENGQFRIMSDVGSNSLEGLEIGRRQTDSLYFNGYIDSAIIFDRALTESEISRISNRL